LFEAPASSYFDLVDVPVSVMTTRNNFYDINDRWLQSDWVGKRQHLLLDWGNSGAQHITRIGPEDPFPPMASNPSCGEVTGERRDGEVYGAELNSVRSCYVLFKMTWHKNWKAYVDGKPEPTTMLSPGFAGIPLGPGRHSITMRYQPETWKLALAFGGFTGVIVLIVLEQRGRLARVESWLPAWPLPNAARRRLLTTAGLILLVLPVCVPLFTRSVLLGHDSFEYFPRLVEFHENITHGVLFPRWAPDLGNGTGQPLFVFHPPMIYYLGEFWHLLGFDFVTSMNLACAAIVFLSALGMFLLARLYFGDAAGWLGSAAYLYAPYFAVDLYVRSAMEEFSIFPFFALALYGFGAYALRRRLRYLLAGAAAYACVLSCHFMVAFVFTPLLVAFLAFTAWREASSRLLWRQIGGWALGLGLSAFIWAPALLGRQNAAINRAVEGLFEYSKHFVYLHQLFYSPWGYGLSEPGPHDGMSFEVGWSHLLLASLVLGWGAQSLKLRDRRLLRFFAAAAVMLCVLMLPNSRWLWDRAPLLHYVNLPWRLLGPTAFCMALLIAPLGRLLSQSPRWRNAGIGAAMAVLIIPNLAHLHPNQVKDIDPTFFTAQQLAARGFETTTMREVTPRWIRTPPIYKQNAATVLSGDASIDRPGRAPFVWSSPVRSTVPSTIEMNTAWFPGWEVRVDGGLIRSSPGPQSGLITFQLPAGRHYMEVRYGRPAVEKGALGISIGALILSIVLALKSGRPATAPQGVAPHQAELEILAHNRTTA
jgi:hypothetical protein